MKIDDFGDSTLGATWISGTWMAKLQRWLEGTTISPCSRFVSDIRRSLAHILSRFFEICTLPSLG